MSKPKKSNYGGVAVEYVIVSTCAVIISITAITFVSQIFKSKLSKMSERLKIEEISEISPDLEIF